MTKCGLCTELPLAAANIEIRVMRATTNPLFPDSQSRDVEGNEIYEET